MSLLWTPKPKVKYLNPTTGASKKNERCICPSSAMVENLTPNLTIKCSNPTIGTDQKLKDVFALAAQL
jgi:hypothetical protein